MLQKARAIASATGCITSMSAMSTIGARAIARDGYTIGARGADTTLRGVKHRHFSLSTIASIVSALALASQAGVVAMTEFSM
jgi:hypothetical protein